MLARGWRAQPAGFYLFGYEEATSDFDLFVFGIAGQAQDFHAVLQRLRNGMHDVRRRNEHDL